MIKEGKQATHWTAAVVPSFPSERSAPATECPGLQPGQPLAQTRPSPPRVKRWSLTSLQQRLVKTGGRLVKHARYYWLLLAEGHLTRRAVRRHVAEDLGAAGAGRLNARHKQRSPIGEEMAQVWSGV